MGRMPQFAHEDIKGNNGTHGSEGRAFTVAQQPCSVFGKAAFQVKYRFQSEAVFLRAWCESE